MDDTAVEIAKLNETATDLLNKYDNAFDSIDERKDEALNKIKDAYDSGKVAMAENALKLEGKSLQEITEQINTQSILNKPKVKLLQNNNLVDLPAGLNESQSLTLKIEDFDKYTKYFVTTTKGDISLDQNTGEITLKAHEILSNTNEELTIEVYYKIGSALSEIFTYKFTVFFLPYEEFTLSNTDLKANNEDMDGFEFDGTDAVALEDNAFYREVETKVEDLKVVGETTLLHKGEIIPIASTSTKDRLDSYKEIKQNQELWLGNNKDGYSKNRIENVETEVDVNFYSPINSSVSIESLKQDPKITNANSIENTFYKDAKGIGWGTNDNTSYFIEIEVPKNATSLKVIFTAPAYDKEMGWFTVQGISDSSTIELIHIQDAWNNINKKVFKKGILDIENWTEDIIDKEYNISINNLKRIKIEFKGYTSSYDYSKNYIKELTFNSGKDKYKADISSFNLTQTPTSAKLDTNIDISTSVQTSANKIISGESLELNIDSTSTTTSLVTKGVNLYEGDKLVIDGKEGTLGTVTPSIGSINTHDIFGDNSAIATYQFDGDVNDLSGNYSGTWSDDGEYTDGIFKQAGKFRSTRYLNTNISKMPESYSVSSWVRYSDVSAYGSILGNAGSNGHNGFSFRASGTNSNYSIDVYSHSQSSSARVSINGSNYINKNNEWYHILCTYDKDTNTMKVYINGILIGTDTSGSAITQTSSMNLTVGKNLSTHTSSSSWNSGDIDQLRIFNRALINSEVQRLYNEEISKFTADISSFSLDNKPKKAYKKQNDKSCITIGTPTTTNISVLNKKQNLITQGQKIFLEGVNRYVDIDSIIENSTTIINKDIQNNGLTQTISTNGALDWEYFTIDNNHYLVVANQYNGSTYNIDSKIYKWNGNSFIEFQSIPTNGASYWEYFTIDNNHYLIVSNYHNGSTYNLNSKIYKWNSNSFIEFQSIPTNGAHAWKHFTIDNNHYLVVSNYHNDSTRNINSKIYKWNGNSFIEFQSIPTNGAYDWKYFTINNNHYLIVSNYYNGSTYNLNSKIYKWNGSSFIEFQSIPTNGAYDWEHFTINNNHYLVVANHYNNSTQNINSKIYKIAELGSKYSITHKTQTSPATGVGLMDTFKTNQILNKTFDGSKISTTLAGQDNIEGEFIQRKIIADKDTKILAPITTSLKKEA